MNFKHDIQVSISNRERVAAALEHAKHLLPSQGPIGVFIHHNTLHAFEHMSFHEAVQTAARVFGCQPYFSEDRYREEWRKGRITDSDLEFVICADKQAAKPVPLLGSRADLRIAAIKQPLRNGSSAELNWLITTNNLFEMMFQDSDHGRASIVGPAIAWLMDAERPGNGSECNPWTLLGESSPKGSPTSWTESERDQSALQLLWSVCQKGVQGLSSHSNHVSRIRCVAEEVDTRVHEVLVPFTAAYVDQGLAEWSLPNRKEGFLAAFMAVFGHSTPSAAPWLRRLPEELARWRVMPRDPIALIEQELQRQSVEVERYHEWIQDRLLALRGWAGMLQHVTERPFSVPYPIAPRGVEEFLAVRLLLDRLACERLNKKPMSSSRSYHSHDPHGLPQRAFSVFQLACHAGLSPRRLQEMTRSDWQILVDEIEQFSPFVRRQVFQEAYERRHRHRTLDAISVRARMPAHELTNPKFQAICCIDEREESFRRALEEWEPNGETFGVAGFFAVPMFYRGAGEAHFAPLCPVVIRPQRWVTEIVVGNQARKERRRAAWRRTIGGLAHRLHMGSRNPITGALLSGFAGAFATIPMTLRVLFPRLAAMLRTRATQIVQPPRQRYLSLERSELAPPGPEPGGWGFTVSEMADAVERLLRDIGLTSKFAPLVFVIGHGSSSLNNPHESAHDCGACGGGRGGPNARTFAAMANNRRVRQLLSERGLPLPSSTHFVGAYHNTCDDALAVYDIDAVPWTHQEALTHALEKLNAARRWDAHERCRRFESAPRYLSADAALRHVEGRAEDLSQVRPEYGHATNAVCFVGRRARTRGLYMDRRAFLASYDPTTDDAHGTILARILAAVVPVCGGISLEYYFSVVDSRGYGCGTKLPHNITGLVGVMDGPLSDLRTGLPWQMVEIHEPVRLLFIFETTVAILERIMDADPNVGRMIRNGWVQATVLDPDSSTIHVYSNGAFEIYSPENTELPRTPSSAAWYQGQRDHLDYALVVPGPAKATTR